MPICSCQQLVVSSALSKVWVGGFVSLCRSTSKPGNVVVVDAFILKQPAFVAGARAFYYSPGAVQQIVQIENVDHWPGRRP